MDKRLAALFFLLYIPFLQVSGFRTHEDISCSVSGDAPFAQPADSLPVRDIFPESLVARADSLKSVFMFGEAMAVYSEAIRATSDSLARIAVEDRRIMAENGMNMLGFCSNPVVIARHEFSLDDFFLFYPLPDKSWRHLPNQLDTAGNHAVVRGMYLPDGMKEHYFSAPDAEGALNIYRTEYRDTVWSLPALVNEHTTSASDEIFPMLAPDGKSLYFASSGLYGVGGYDLYVSEWNEDLGDWGVPVNMGFPYSSPADDFLFINTSDGKYTIFASNRDCPKDSVYVYVLEFENMPVRKAVDDMDEFRRLMELVPVDDPARMDNGSTVAGSMPDNVDTRRYMQKVAELRALRDSIYIYGKSLDEERSRFATSDDDRERERLTVDILHKEAMIPVIQDSLDKVTAALQQIEMEFLFSGVVIDPDKIMAEADKEIVGASSGYTFTKMSFGPAPAMKMEKPVEKFDYSFMILPEGRFAESNELPSGLVYQIQIFSSSRKAEVSQLKGLSPVFEQRSAAGKYVYRVGVFPTYKDVLSNLNKVKRAGFRSAFITAFSDGQPVTVQKARALENTVKQMYRINIYYEGDSLPELAVKAVAVQSGKDVAKIVEGGTTVFVAGPFDDREEAEKVAAALKAAGISNLSLETLKM